jgi:hypothetical protein
VLSELYFLFDTSAAFLFALAYAVLLVFWGEFALYALKEEEMSCERKERERERERRRERKKEKEGKRVM